MVMTAQHTAWAQIALSFAFVGAYFFVLTMFLLGYVRVPSDFRDAFTALLGVITANVGQVVSYWFARQRPSTPGNPTGG